MHRSRMLSWVLIGVGYCGYAAAADALPPSLRACMQETDAGRRLACFDRASALLAGDSAPVARQVDPAPVRPAPAAPAAPVASAAPAAPVASAGATAAATGQSAEDKFGYRGNMARADLDKKKAEEQSGDLTAKVAKVETLAHGELLLTLENGQMWQQKAGDRGLRVKVGDEVTIKRGVLNSFLLTTQSTNGSMRVARVR